MLKLESGELVTIEHILKISADRKTAFLPFGLTTELTEGDYEIICEALGAFDAEQVRQRIAEARRQQSAMGKGLLVPQLVPGNGRAVPRCP